MTPFFGLFGGKGEDDKTSDPEEARQEKRREMRLDVGEPSLTLALDIAGGGRTVEAQVVNVSARGLRLKMPSDVRSRLTVGQEMAGVLTVEKFSVRLALRVVRLIGEGECGFRIRPPFPKELEQLERFLEPRFLGRSLREIDPKALQRDAGDGRRMRWFQGLNETNLFSWEDGAGAVVHQQLVFLERVVEWDLAQPVKTGRIRGEGPSLPGWVKADLLEFDAAPDGEFLDKARVLMANAAIDTKVKEGFMARLG